MASFIQKLFNRETAAPTPAAPDNDPWQPRLAWRGDEVIAEHELTVERLLFLFRQAYMPVETAEDGRRLNIRSDTGLRISVVPDAPRRLIGIIAIFALKADAPMAQKLACANRLNDDVIVLRAAVANETTLCLDHQMVCDGGVMAAAVVGAVRRFGRIAPQALQDCFSADLLE